jgi:hypothetical protein
MAAKFTRLTHKIAIQLHVVAESCTICSSRSRWPVRKLLDTPSYSSAHSLTSALDWSKWSVSCPGRFTPRERAPGTHWIGSWVDPGAGLNVVVKRKIQRPCRYSNVRSPIRKPKPNSHDNFSRRSPIPNFTKIRRLILETEHTDGHDVLITS